MAPLLKPTEIHARRSSVEQAQHAQITQRQESGKLLGVYVVLFVLMAQLLNRVRFGQSPTAPIYAGGALIVAGGLVMAFWRV